jgi:sec-independent protein translocase protein TatB
VFNLSFGEMALIAIVALVVLGPEQLPSLARFLGKTMGEFRRTADEFNAELRSSFVDSPPRLTTTEPRSSKPTEEKETVRTEQHGE